MAMAATPEDVPFSPSVFLDLPPTPPPRQDSDDDLILPYISRMLMEDDIDDKFFYQFPDHPALLTAQQPYVDILSAATSDDSGDTTSSGGKSSSASHDVENSLRLGEVTNNDGNTSFAGAAKNRHTMVKDVEANTTLAGDMDMLKLNQAFLKGMEEANKFLPVNSSLAVDVEAISRKLFLASAFPAGQVSGRGRKNSHSDSGDELEAEAGRSRKLMAPEREEAGAGEMLDDIMLHGQELCMKGMEELRIAMDNDAGEKRKKKKTGRKERVRVRVGAAAAEVVVDVDLRAMLVSCAQAVATGDRRGAAELLAQAKRHSSAGGDATQRLAHCFSEGLEARLAGAGSDLYQSLVAQRTSVVEFLRAYVLYFVACPFNKVKFTFDNLIIMNAAAGRPRLHIVDFGVQYGFQWPGLLQCLAERDGGPPEVRITGVDFPQPGFRPALQIEETGRRLSHVAREYGVPFTFRGVAARWETVRAEDLDLDAGEVLVVVTQSGLTKLMDDGGEGEGASPRDAVLRNVRAMRPDVFLQWVVHGGFGAPFFPTRFREALYFYSAMFDVLEATIPRGNDDRRLVERDILGRGALNVIACEGGDRVDRPETYKQWAVRNHRAGLRQLPLQPEVVKMVREKVMGYHHRDFVVDEDRRWLLQGWKGRVLFAMSAWVADDAAATASTSP